MSDSPITVVARVLCRPEKIGEMRQLLADVAQRSRQESGCLGYSVLRGREEPHEVITVEIWKDQAAIDAHMASAHVGELFARVPGLVASAPEIRTYAAV